ncbi:MAG: hypothetical protein WC742_04800 [Gallionellaceae bacterium]|jgi:hypothetical protein
MKKLFAIAIFILLIPCANAGEMHSGDTGVFTVLSWGGGMSTSSYRVLKKSEVWSIERKELGGNWKIDICNSDCDFRTATEDEIKAILSPRWRSDYSISCIINSAQAFCRLDSLDTTSNSIYVMVSFVDGNRIPSRLKRFD